MRGSKVLVTMMLVILAVSTVLSSCAKPEPTATPKPPPTKAPEKATAVPAPAGFDWKQFEGQTVSVILNKHPAAEAMIGQIPDFEAKTGIKVEYEILAESEYFAKLPLELASGTGLYDVLMTGPMIEWEYVPGNWLEDLRPYLDDATMTDIAWYDEGDFYPSLFNANRWSGKLGGGVGEGSQWGIPIMVETYLLAYRGDLADEYGVDTPETIEELYDFAKVLYEGERAKGNDEFYGGVVRGHPNAATCCGFQSMMNAYAETERADFAVADGKFKSVINQPSLVALMDTYVAIMRDFGPPGWNTVTWYDAKELYSTGNYGFFTDCDFFAYSYEDPERSQAAGKTRYAVCPYPEGGEPVTSVWTWSLAMCADSKEKDVAWYFIQYMTGPEQLAKGTIEYNNFNPTRASVFEHPDVVAVMGSWGQGTYLPAVKKNLQVAQITQTVHPQGRETGEIWVRAMHAIWQGADAKTELDKAAADIDEVMEKAGLVPEVGDEPFDFSKWQ